MNRAVRFLLAALSGALFAFAFPNVAIGALAFVALLPLLLALGRTSGGREAFLLGWLSQMIAWLLMVPWVIRVMSHYGGLPLPVGIAIFCAMALYLGMYGGLFAWLVWRIAPGASVRRWLLVPLAWAAVEYVRTYLFTGFPWNLIAAAIVDLTSFVQFDRVAGPYLLGAMIVVPSAIAAWWILNPATGIKRLFVASGTIIFLFVWWASGLVAAKLFTRPSGQPMATAALLQPNISQQMRWSNENVITIYQRMVGMTVDAFGHGVKVVIWPESTVPLSFAATDFFRDSVEELSREHDADIMLGSVAEDQAQPNRLWNAAFLVSSGRIIGHYDKIKLVPFGEYVPMRTMLFFAEKLVHDVGEFEFGTRDTPLDGRFRYGPAICYEVVYPQIGRQQVVHGANVLVTITNDAWYDGTSAPRQHLNQARLRAVETDRFLLRAGTTGISALVDPAGQIRKQIPMGQQGIIYAEFEPRHSKTGYVRFGDWFAWLACAGVAFAALRLRPRASFLPRKGSKT